MDSHTTGIVVVDRVGEASRYQARCACGWPGREFAERGPADADALEHLRVAAIDDSAETHE